MESVKEIVLKIFNILKSLPILLYVGIFIILFSTWGYFKYQAYKKQKLYEQKKTISVVSFNVAGRQIYVRERVPKLLEVLKGSEADIIALQEVKPWFMRILLSESWLDDYFSSFPMQVDLPPGKLLLLSKFPILKSEYLEIESNRIRSYLRVDVEAYSRELSLGVIHLDPELEAGEMRVRQLATAFSPLKPKTHALLIGDYNFGDGEEPETSNLPRTYTDIWRTLHPLKPGFTWNNEKNPLAKAKALPGEPSRRLDRLLLKSPFWVPQSMKIIGNEPANGEGTIFPSDHFGLYAQITLKNEEAIEAYARAQAKTSRYEGLGITVKETQGGTRIRLDGLNFGRGKIHLTRRAKLYLKNLLPMLRGQFSGYKILVEGHTDNKGSDQYNRRLSDGRSDTVKKYLEQHGIPAKNLSAKGFLYKRPLVPNTNNYNRSLNRRVEFFLSRRKKI